MIILNSKEMIFVHIQKTGGTTVEISMAPLIQWTDIIVAIPPFEDAMEGYYQSRFNIDKHSPAKQIKELVGQEIWDRYFSWATVRDPYERIASLFSYIAATIETRFIAEKKPNPENHVDDVHWLESKDYPDHAPWSYLASKAYISTRARRNSFSEFLRSPFLEDDPGFKPQVDFLFDDSGKELLVKRCVKVERLQDEWLGILASIGASELPLISSNVTPPDWRKPTNELFKSHSDIEFINQRFQQDFVSFDYEMR